MLRTARLALATVACLLLLPACTTLRGRAEAAYAKGDYLEAAQLYDELARDQPHDASAKAARDRARQAAVGAEVDKSRVLRTTKQDDAAAEAAERGLRLAHGWSLPTDGPIATEAAAAGMHVKDAAIGATPLRGEAILERWSNLLAYPELAGLRDDTMGFVVAKGRAECDSLASDTPASQPFARWAVARFCGHFGVAIERPALPGLRRGLEVEGAIGGVDPPTAAGFRSELAAAFQRSVWFDPSGAGGPVVARLDGRIAVAIHTRRVTLTRDWTESVPYTDYEDVQESYEEPYTDTELVTKQVPYTEYRTRTYPCGDTTCTEMVPETCYRTETETQIVTKYRTAWRTVQRAVTRYRDEPRVFTFDADEVRGHYDSDLAVVGSDPPFRATERQSFDQHGYDHDVTFAPAGVSPSRADLPTRVGFVASERKSLAQLVVNALDARWREQRCTNPPSSLDSAAACAYLDAKGAPASVHAMLAQTFGDDEPLLARLLVR